MTNDSLDALRAEIDILNGEILEAFIKRMRVSEAIAEIKRGLGTPTYVPAREKQIIDKVRGLSGIYADYSEQLFLNIMKLSRERQAEFDRIAARKSIALVGMPGAGKSAVGRRLSELMHEEFIDTDAAFMSNVGMSAEKFIEAYGEAAFRQREAELICALTPTKGRIIATGGGCILSDAVRTALKTECTCVYIRRNLAQLPIDGRPISQSAGVETLYMQRNPLYEAAADFIVYNDGTIDETADRILGFITESEA